MSAGIAAAASRGSCAADLMLSIAAAPALAPALAGSLLAEGACREPSASSLVVAVSTLPFAAGLAASGAQSTSSALQPEGS